MESIKILIVEDEVIIAKDLSYMLQDVGYQIAGIAHDATSAMDAIASSNPDLVLLDINLEGSKDGIELAKMINESHNIPFIFLTSFGDTATIAKAKMTNPLAYLIKPIDEKDLAATIEIAMNNYNKRIIGTTLQKDNLQNFLFIKEGQSHRKLEVQSIIYAEACDNYAYIFTESKKYLLSSTLKLVDDKLAPWGFKRIHRSYLINPDFIVKIEDSSVHLPNISLPISKKYKAQFLKELNFL